MEDSIKKKKKKMKIKPISYKPRPLPLRRSFILFLADWKASQNQ